MSISEHIEQPPPPSSSIQTHQTSEKKTSNWFRKRSKDEKNKIPKSESPPKETESTETGNCATLNPPVDVIDGQASVTEKEVIQEKIKKLGLDFFSEDFEGVTVSSTKCLSCEGTTEQKETMIDLSVPITENMVDAMEQSSTFIQVRI